MALTISEANAVSKKYFDKAITQIVYQGSHLFSYLAKNKKIKYKGGTSYQFPIRYRALDNARTSAWREQIEFTSRETRTAGDLPLIKYVATTNIFEDERISNAGPGEIVDLIKDRSTELTEELGNKLYTDIYATTQDSDAIQSLATIVDTTTTYAGISPTDATNWKAAVESTETSLPLRSPDGTSVSGYMSDCTFNNKKPTHIYTTEDIWETFEAAVAPNRRYTASDNKAELGFEYITFRNAKVLSDKFMPDGYLYILNLDVFELFCWTQGEMGVKVKDWMDLTDQGYDETWAKLAAFVGNLKCTNRRLNGKCTSLTGGIVG